MSVPPTMQMRQVLAQLELISHGATQAWDSDGRGGGERLLPPGELYPPHLYYRHLWDRATSDERRQSVYSEAVIALQDITLRDPAKRRESLDEREIMRGNVLAATGWTPRAISQTYNYAEKHIRRIRLEEERDPDSGEISPGLAANEGGWAARLQDEGMSQARIAERMGVSQSTVSRLLKYRRNAAA